MTLGLENRVAVVTGAGRGLGRAHARMLAARGAKVVVNDAGGSLDGREADPSVADSVVAEIKADGGEAIASYDSVADRASAKAIVDRAIDTYGKIDILVNNAGILRDRSFAKAELDDFDEVLRVHLQGTVYCTHAAWPHMSAGKYGRVVMTTSVSGTNGNFGQSAYSAAKMGIIGFMNTLAIEGRKNNIFVNSISPAAMTRMTADLIPAELAPLEGPELVSPAVAWMCSEDCKETGLIISASAAGFKRVHYFETEGVQFDPLAPPDAQQFEKAVARICDLETAKPTELGVLGDAEERLRSIGRLP
jgi:NAD(P)-dependent dehydrogenase (short-subunit alcohol dehydrogenase family)